MKHALVAFVIAAAVRAQTRGDVPECAVDCLDDAIRANTNCAIDDYPCVCPEFDSIQGDATGCVVDSCGADTALNEVLPAVEALCAAEDEPTGTVTEPPEVTVSSSYTPVPTLATVTDPPRGPIHDGDDDNDSNDDSNDNGGEEEEGEEEAPPTTSETAPGSDATAGAAVIGPMGGGALLLLGVLAL